MTRCRPTRWRERRSQLLLCALLLPWSLARAELPTPIPPSNAPQSGDFLGLIKGYIKDGGLVLGLTVAVAAFVWAAWAAIAKFNEARNGRAEWGEVGLLSVVAGGILVFDSYLLGTAAGIIS